MNGIVTETSLKQQSRLHKETALLHISTKKALFYNS